jgi:chromosome segregation ATPase
MAPATQRMAIPIVLTGLAVCAGCAGNDTVPFREDLARAESSVDHAEEAGAFEHGSAEFNMARDKLTAAEDAAEDGDEELAARLATEAELDAELASAIAERAEAQAAVAELRESIQTLREELNRGQSRL